MADLKEIGRILGVLGGLLMVVFGVIFAVNNFIGEILDVSLLGFSIVGNTLGESAWHVTAAVMIVCGLIGIYGYKELSGKKKSGLLLWGLIYLIIGIVGGSVGALLALIGGIILILDYFI